MSVSFEEVSEYASSEVPRAYQDAIQASSSSRFDEGKRKKRRPQKNRSMQFKQRNNRSPTTPSEEDEDNDGFSESTYNLSQFHNSKRTDMRNLMDPFPSSERVRNRQLNIPNLDAAEETLMNEIKTPPKKMPSMANETKPTTKGQKRRRQEQNRKQHQDRTISEYDGKKDSNSTKTENAGLKIPRAPRTNRFQKTHSLGSFGIVIPSFNGGSAESVRSRRRGDITTSVGPQPTNEVITIDDDNDSLRDADVGSSSPDVAECHQQTIRHPAQDLAKEMRWPCGGDDDGENLKSGASRLEILNSRKRNNRKGSGASDVIDGENVEAALEEAKAQHFSDSPSPLPETISLDNGDSDSHADEAVGTISNPLKPNSGEESMPDSRGKALKAHPADPFFRREQFSASIQSSSRNKTSKFEKSESRPNYKPKISASKGLPAQKNNIAEKKAPGRTQRKKLTKIVPGKSLMSETATVNRRQSLLTPDHGNNRVFDYSDQIDILPETKPAADCIVFEKKQPRHDLGRKNNLSPMDGHHSGESMGKAKGLNFVRPPKDNQRFTRRRRNESDVIDLYASDEGELDFGETTPTSESNGGAEGREERELEEAKRRSVETKNEEEARRAVGDRYTADAIRIAVGSKVYTSKCDFSMQPSTARPWVLLSYDQKSPSTLHLSCEIRIYLSDIDEIYYFIEDDDADISDTEAKNHDIEKISSKSYPTKFDQASFIALRVSPNNCQNLQHFRQDYLQSHSREEVVSDEDLIKKYIVVEFRSNDRFLEVLKLMQEDESLGGYLTKAKLSLREVGEFTRAFAAVDDLERRKRFSSPLNRESRRKSRTELPLAGGDILLVYPFPADEDVLDSASKGLHEPRDAVTSQSGTQPVYLDPPAIKTSSRAHYLTIRDEDLDRLEFGEFLNDTIIDFWMKWISRKEDPAKSLVHFFTSHFFTTLQMDGERAVASWTAKKNIDVFAKKLIFIPINEDLHWSLCIVVNPGVAIGFNWDEIYSDTEVPFILFLDSLKAHRKGRVAKIVRKWLNFEYKERRNQREPDIYNPLSMPVFAPKIPYQDNSWDCGVFVCRYAYALYMRRSQTFQGQDLNEYSMDLKEKAITSSKEFQFDMSDIQRLRKEIQTLLRRLSGHYLEQKAAEGATKSDKTAKENIKESPFKRGRSTGEMV